MRRNREPSVAEIQVASNDALLLQEAEAVCQKKKGPEDR